MAEQHDTSGSRPDPAEHGRLGFSRLALSLVGVIAVLAFLVWFLFLP